MHRSRTVNQLALDEHGHPSHDLHGNERWFVFDVTYVPELKPTFPNTRQFTEIYAGSTSGVRVPLVIDVDLEIISQPIWSPDDSTITFVAEQWDVDDNGLPIALNVGAHKLDTEFTEGAPQAPASCLRSNPAIRGRRSSWATGKST